MDDELKNLVSEEQGKLANAAADASLTLLSMLGAMPDGAEANQEYRNEVCGGLVRVFLTLQAVERCLKHANPQLSDGQLLAGTTATIADMLGADGRAVLQELLQQSRDAGKTD